MIRRTSLTVIALVVALDMMSVWSQERSPYVALEDLFSIDFPGEPTVHESTYTTELGIVLPARVYTAEDSAGRYSVTVVDWRDTDALYETLLDGCQDCDEAMPNDIRGSSSSKPLSLARHSMRHSACSNAEVKRRISHRTPSKKSGACAFTC